MYKRYGVWVLYFIYATLSVTIYILCTQKWAGGHTVPSRYGASADTYNCRTYRHIKYLYMVFLVKILFKHIVVDGGVKCTNDIYGGGIHMNPPLRMRTHAYTIIKTKKNRRLPVQVYNVTICEEFSMRNVCSVGSHPDAYFSVFIAKRPANNPHQFARIF